MQTLYYHITALSGPLLKILLSNRLKKGKEDPARYIEKTATISKSRPKGALLWIHAASVGEAQSALILMDKCLAEYPNIHILLTTGTLSSANLMGKKLPERAFHQFCSLDHPQWVKQFHDHWKPDAVLWMESELWPNMLSEIKLRKIPAILVNARLSKASFNSWSYFKNFARNVLSTFDVIICQTEQDKIYFEKLGAPVCIVTDNIKYSAKLLDFNKLDFDSLSKSIYSRPLWVLASTHAGEEEVACRIHEILKMKLPDLLTIIIPRHPERRDEILKTCSGFQLKFCLRGEAKKLPSSSDDIYIADTFGELGLFYRISPLAFIGRSLSKDGGGGHNPIEAAQLGCVIIHGKNIQNLREIYDDMDARGAAICVDDEATMTGIICDFLTDYKKLQTLQAKALKFSKEKSGAIDRAMAEILPRLEQPFLKSRILVHSDPKDTTDAA